MRKALRRYKETIVDAEGGIVGTLRIKPSSILWKPKSAREFYAVSLDAFASWITGPTSGAKKAKK